MGRLKNPYLLSLVVSVENGSASRRPIRHGGGSGAWPSQRGQIPASGQDRRPADVLLPYWNGGKDAALDVTVARHTGQEEGEAVLHLWGRLGVLLQGGNAAILGNRVPAFPPRHIDGIA